MQWNVRCLMAKNRGLAIKFTVCLKKWCKFWLNWICETLCTALWDPFFSHFPSGTFERHFITNAIYVHKLSIQLMYLHEGGGSGFSQPTHSTVEKYNFLFSPRVYKSNPRVDNAIAWYSTMGWQTELQTACHVNFLFFIYYNLFQKGNS